MFVSYAQNFEDVMLNRVFKGKDSGFYVDVGSHHPTYDSVTKAFYDRGWSGINIEPVKEFFDLLQQQRPRDTNLNIAISDCESQNEFFELPGTGYSTLDSATAINIAQEKSLHIYRYQVSARTLADVCKEKVNCKIDFLKIDVAGWEEQVVVGHDWQAFRPTLVLIEATVPGYPVRRKTDIANFLQARDYQHVYFDGVNDYYLAREASTLKSCFDSPPNVFDNFVSFNVLDLATRVENLQQTLQARNEEISHLNSTIDNLKTTSEPCNRQLTIVTNYWKDERIEVKRLTEALIQFQKVKDEAVNYWQERSLELEKQLSQSNEFIDALKTTNFWKVRELWIVLREKLGTLRG